MISISRDKKSERKEFIILVSGAMIVVRYSDIITIRVVMWNVAQNVGNNLWIVLATLLALPSNEKVNCLGIGK